MRAGQAGDALVCVIALKQQRPAIGIQLPINATVYAQVFGQQSESGVDY
jgi:hypothetical protein